MAMWNDYEKIARRLDRIANAFERIAKALETANIIEADRKTEPQRGCDADCNEDCTECAKEWQDWKDQMWTEAVETEPQTDCAWQNDEHIPTELASSMLKNRFKEQNDG